MDRVKNMHLSLYQIIAILVYHVTFVRYYYISNYTIPTVIMSIPICLYIGLKIKIIYNDERYKKINLLLMTFSCLILISSIVNFSNFDSSALFVLKLWICFLFFEYLHIINKLNNVLLIYVFLSTIYVSLSLIIYKNNVSLFYDYGKNYLIGNKFDVSYITYISFILLFVFFKNTKKNNLACRLITAAYYLFSLIVAFQVGCSTMIIGNILTILLYFIRDKILREEKNIIITIFISTIFLFVFSKFLNISFVNDFITNVLKKDSTLTGRTVIYSYVFKIILQNVFFGVGYGNSYTTFVNTMGAANAQNAILDWGVQIGIFGTLFLLIIVKLIFKNIKMENIKKIKPIIVAIYVFSILGMVEITFNMYFFTLLAIINYGYRLKKKEDKKNERKIINKECYI